MATSRAGFALNSNWARARARLFSISPAEATFAHRGFRAERPELQARLEKSGETFIAGYNRALGSVDLGELADELDRIENEYRGFGYEGAAMALSLLRELAPWHSRLLTAFLQGPAQKHIYMAHVGIGWAYARVPWRKHRVLTAIRTLDPLLKWLAIDGFGFHHGYFRWRACAEMQTVPRGLEGYALQAFDQGLGRSLWFGCGGDPVKVAATVKRFPLRRRADLWSGVGLACAYAGAVGESEIEFLLRSAGEDHAPFRQGVAFAAKARELAGNPARHTELAANLACGCSAAAAAALTDHCLAAERSPAKAGSYESWRKLVQQEIVRTRIEQSHIEQKQEILQ